MNVVSGPKLQENKERILDFRNGDFNKFKSMLDIINWDKEFKDKNFVMWKQFKHILESIQSKCFKEKPIRVAKRKPVWWNREIKGKSN